MMRTFVWSLLYLWLGASSLACAQQQYDGYYEQDSYAQDNLYHDYAARQAEKGQVGAAA